MNLRSFLSCTLVNLTLLSTAARAESPGDCFPAGTTEWRCGHRRAIEDLATPHGPGDPQAETPWTDVLYTRIDIEVDPAAHAVSGTVTISARSQIAGLATFVIYLDPAGGAMSITSVGGAAASYTHVLDRVTLNLDHAYNAGEEFTVTVSYAGTPTRGVYWGSYNPGTGSYPIVATLSEPFNARGWWPGKDVLNDKAIFDIWLTVPQDYTAVSNGLLEGVDPLSGDRRRFRWHGSYPMIPYLASMAIAKYDQFDLTYSHLGDTMPMNFFMMPNHNNATSQGYCATYVTQTQVFSDLFGQYPFINEKGGMVETPSLGGIFMEHQTIPSMPTFQYLTINAHELAHQWWGDDVTCETWGDIWLNEGMASYSQALWDEYRPGGGYGYYWGTMMSMRPSNTDALVYVQNVNDFNTIFNGTVYNKGAWVAHMLRHVVGNEAFFQAIRDYRAAHQGNSATTAEFTAAMPASVGWDLAWYTDQWIMNAGSPDYSFAAAHGLVGGQNYAYIYIDQTQTTRGYPLMTMPVDVRITTASGDTTYVVWVQDASGSFAIPVDGVPTNAVLDPDAWVLTHSVTSMSAPAAPPPCQGDANGDGVRDGRDISAFVNAATGATSGPSAWKRSDMNFDGRTNAADVAAFISVLLGTMPCP